MNPILIDCSAHDDAPDPGKTCFLEPGDSVRLLIRAAGPSSILHPPSSVPLWVKLTAVRRPPLFRPDRPLNSAQRAQIRYTGVPDDSDLAALTWLPDRPLQFLPDNILQIA